jgi:acyl dehydratase
MMRIISDGYVLDSSSMGGPGIEEARWLAPLRPGTRIRVRATVLETRASNSRPDMGLTKFRFEVLDASETCLMTLTTTQLFGRRNAGAAA